MASVSTPSGSSSKESEKVNPSSTEDFNFLMNTASLSEVFDFAQTECKGCGHASNRTVKVDASRKIGLCQRIIVSCICGERQTFFSSKRIDPSNDKSRFDINIRTVITFRELGLGYTPLLNFSRHMNMPAPLKQFSYERIMNMIHPYYAQAAEESMNKAASCY